MPSDEFIRSILEASAALQRAATLAAEHKHGRVHYLLRCANAWCLEAVKKVTALPIEVRDEQEQGEEVQCD
jgi:hypothetical protein